MSSKTFRASDGGAPFEAIRDLSFTIGRGELVAILGKTGCGKSTTFNLISGLIRAVARPRRGPGPRSLRRFRLVSRQDRHRLSERPADAVAHGDRQCRARHGAQQGAGAGASRHRRGLAGAARACPATKTTIRMRCPAACASASRSRAPLPASRTSCCATSRSARSTSIPAMRCARSFAICCAKPAPPRSSSPIRSTRRWRSASGSWCSSGRRASPSRRSSAPT